MADEEVDPEEVDEETGRSKRTDAVLAARGSRADGGRFPDASGKKRAPSATPTKKDDNAGGGDR